MSNLSEEQKDALAIIHDGLYSDPETRALYEELVVKKFPKAATAMPERTVRAESTKAIEELRKEREEYRKEREADKQKGETERRRQRLLNGFTAADGTFVQISREDLPKVEELMIQTGNADHDTAAWRFVREREVAAPRTSGPSRQMLVPGLKGAGGEAFKWLEPGIKGDLSDLDRVTRAEAYRVWDEVTQGRTPGAR